MSHTSDCIAARGGVDAWPLMRELKVAAQLAVLVCPDGAHDSVRLILEDRPCVPPALAEWATS